LVLSLACSVSLRASPCAFTTQGAPGRLLCESEASASLSSSEFKRRLAVWRSRARRQRAKSHWPVQARGACPGVASVWKFSLHKTAYGHPVPAHRVSRSQQRAAERDTGRAVGQHLEIPYFPFFCLL